MGNGVSVMPANQPLSMSDVLEKPMDASDITSLAQAQQEIANLRALAAQLYKTHEPLIKGSAPETEISENGVGGPAAPHKAKKPQARAAIFAGNKEVEDYELKVIPKLPAVRKLLVDSIANSVLFKACEPRDIETLVDAFEPLTVSDGDTVIKQGEQGNEFFVVESGSLRVFVTFPGATEVTEVRVPYKRGESFGELALMYNNPRAATVRASSDCSLWFINRLAVRTLLTRRRKEEMRKRVALLCLVHIGDTMLQDMMSKQELQQLAEMLDSEVFQAQECIVRQGESGDAFYIVESGEVTVFQRKQDDGHETGLGEIVGILHPGDYFGERALVEDESRAASCVSTSDDTACLSLCRSDFDRLLGGITAALARNAGLQRKASLPALQKEEPVHHAPATGTHPHFVDASFAELDIIRTLGVGAFGSVKLVKHKGTGKGYALKCQAKKGILDNELQNHVLGERKLLMELDHPFILKLHNSFQDDSYVYFVLEVLLGGELFTHLRRVGQFSESDARFYTGSVLHAFAYIHERKIAYRDLKPENLVMDSDGYIKVCDFGLAKVVPSGMLWTICGTPDYLAPEIILNEGHDYGVDYWALGVFTYEMVAGTPPFYAEEPMAIYEKILGNKLNLPEMFSKNLRDLIRKLLKSSKTRRLGRTTGGSGAVMKHKWYSGFDWEGLSQRKLVPPIIPLVTNPLDASNFDPSLQNLEDPVVPKCPEWYPEF